MKYLANFKVITGEEKSELWIVTVFVLVLTVEPVSQNIEKIQFNLL